MGTQCSWHPIDLCEKNATKVIRLIKSLSTPGDELDRRVVVTTHASLIAAFARIEDSGRLFYYTTVIIDEGHHVQAGDSDYYQYMHARQGGKG